MTVSICFDVFGEKLKVFSDSELLLDDIRVYCFPCFEIVEKCADDIGYSIFVKCSVDFSVEHLNFSPDFTFLDPDELVVEINKDRAFFKHDFLGSGWWDKKSAEICIEGRNPRYSARFKYIIYSIFFDWLYTRGYFVIHGAAVSNNGMGGLMVGDSGVGKSTLSYALMAEKFMCFGDNAVLIKQHEDGYYLYPFLHYISLKIEDLDYYPVLNNMYLSGQFLQRKADKLSFPINYLCEEKLQAVKLKQIIIVKNCIEDSLFMQTISEKETRSELMKNINLMVLSNFLIKKDIIHCFAVNMAQTIDRMALVFHRKRSNIELVAKKICGIG